MRTIARSLAIEMALQERARGRRIATLRERAHLTQEVAAERSGVTLRAYQEWEAGGGIRFANLQKLASVLGTTVEEITGQAETPSPFRVSDQLDGIVEQFSGRVDDVETRLDGLEAKLDMLLTLIRPLVRRDDLAPPGELGRRATDSPPSTRDQQETPRRRAADAQLGTG